MPRQSKSKSEVVETTAPAVDVTPVVEKATKAKKESKPKATKVEVKTSEPVVVAASTSTSTSSTPVVETPVTEVVETDVADLSAQSAEFLSKLNQMSSFFGALKNEFRALEKKWSREIKTAQKSQAKRKRKSGNRQPSGFVKPTKISDELAKFLEKPVGSEMARTDVTREINKYIRSHNLQDKENGRKINPDSKLQVLLKLNTTDELTYFNLQRYMSPHFYKADKTLAAAAATATA
jgi:upstream activation factor subunit UAF30